MKPRVARLLLLLLLPGSAPGQTSTSQEKVFYDVLDARGVLSGGQLFVSRPLSGAERLAPRAVAAPVATLLDNGPPSNRLDIVFLGDGYTASELGTYAANVDTVLNYLLSIEPFSSYRTFFNAYRVDVVSNESGVDNDPTLGITRDTALDMAFYCYGVDRALCLDLNKAFAYAQSAPQADLVVTIANTRTYGGTGYPQSHLVAISGGYTFAGETLAHESGHGIANLADEYDYDAPGPWPLPEPEEPNVSIYPSATMAQRGTKWALWLGDPGIGYAGLVDTYLGAKYHKTGIYRPTLSSRMRVSFDPFNLPSVEALIVSFYRAAHPIDDATPTGTLLDPASVVFVDPIDPPVHPLEVAWFLDGNPLPGATEDTLRLASFPIGAGMHVVSVRIRDLTAFVRGPGSKNTVLTETRSWSLFSDVDVLLQSRPNPFAGETTIHYTLAAGGKVAIRVFDSSGRRVRTLVDEVVGPGIHLARWAGDTDAGGQAAAGIYFYRIDYPDHSTSLRKLVLVR